MKKPGSICMLLLVCITLLQVAGCVTTESTVSAKKERFFWPVLPDTPRIEFIDAITGVNSLNRDKAGGLLSAILGEEEDAMLLDHPVFATSDGMGKIFVADQKYGGVVQIDLKMKTMGFLGGEQASNFIGRAAGIAIDADMNVYVADTTTKKVYVLDKSGATKAVIDISAQVAAPGGLAVDKSRKRLIVPDIKGHKIAVFGLDGSFISSIGKRGDGDTDFNYPTSVAVDREGNIVVCDSMNARIVRLTPDLKFINKIGKRGDGIGTLAVPKGVAVDSEGHIYVTDGKQDKIVIFNEHGELLLQFGGFFAAMPGTSIAPGGFRTPMGIFIDQNDTIYVSDLMNARVHIYQYMNEKYVRENPY